MNSPKPCDTCAFLHADCTQEEDPSHMTECWLGLPRVTSICLWYHDYESISNEERDRIIAQRDQPPRSPCAICGSPVQLDDATLCNGCWEMRRRVESLRRQNPVALKTWLQDQLSCLEGKEPRSVVGYDPAIDGYVEREIAKK